MTIVVNTRLLLKERLEGIGWFTYETLRRITRDHPEHRFVFLFDRPYSDEFIFSDNITPVVVGPPTRHPLLWYLWFEHRLPAVLKKYHADLFFSPDGYLSLKTNVPQYAVIHDINFVHRPGDLPLLTSRYYNHYFPLFARKACRLGTVSEFSKSDICSAYGIQPEKIDVVFNGVNEGFLPLSQDERARVREEFTGGAPYFLFVGALHPRKNVEGLLLAFDRFKSLTGHKLRLLIAGGQMFKTGTIHKTYLNMEHKDEVTFAGRLSPAALFRVMGAAQALVFVPFFEGFGIPPIEAMAAGVPVICSNTTSLPEVGGDAVLYVNPDSHEEICRAMKQLAENEELRIKLIAKGNSQVQKFSWEKTAGRLWLGLEQVLARKC